MPDSGNTGIQPASVPVYKGGGSGLSSEEKYTDILVCFVQTLNFKSIHPVTQEEMEVILLSFCLMSLCITALLVMFALHRQSPPEMPDFNEELPEHDDGFRLDHAELLPEKPPTDFLRHRVEDVLKQQMQELGYLSEERQHEFLKAVLKKETVAIPGLTPSELRTVFSSIIELREGRGERVQMARSA